MKIFIRKLILFPFNLICLIFGLIIVFGIRSKEKALMIDRKLYNFEQGNPIFKKRPKAKRS